MGDLGSQEQVRVFGFSWEGQVGVDMESIFWWKFSLLTSRMSPALEREPLLLIADLLLEDPRAQE